MISSGSVSGDHLLGPHLCKNTDYAVQWVEHALSRLVSFTGFLVGSYRRLDKRYLPLIQPCAQR